jgi:hypothetical protein
VTARSGRIDAALVACVAGVAGLALALRLLGFLDPFSTVAPDFLGAFGANFTGGPVSNMADRGLFHHIGMPYTWGFQTVDGSWWYADYTHHPATFMWLCALALEVFGHHEWALRVVPLVGSLFSVVAFARLGHAAAGRRAALAAALLAAALPFAARHGMQAWTEGTIVGTTAMLLLHHLEWLRHGSAASARRAGLWLLVGTLFDWTALFVVPVLALHALLRRASPEGASDDTRAARWRYVLGLGLLGSVPVALHATHILSVTPSRYLVEEGHSTLRDIVALPEGIATTDFLAWQWAYVREGFTVTALVLAALGAAAGRSVLDGPARVVAVLGVAPGVLYTGLFPGRSFNHDFFPMIALPGVVLLAVAGVLVLARASRVLAALALAGAVAHGAVVTVREYQHHRDGTMRELVRADAVAEVLGDERTLVLTNSLGVGSFLPFYARAQVRDGQDDPATILGSLEVARTRLHPDWRLCFLLDRTFEETVPMLTLLHDALASVAEPRPVDVAGRRLVFFELLPRARDVLHSSAR